MPSFPPEVVAKYRAALGNRCPYCDEYGVCDIEISLEMPYVMVYLSCPTCDGSWHEVYELVDVVGHQTTNKQKEQDETVY